MKEHFAQTVNETEHLRKWKDVEDILLGSTGFFAYHLVLVYYWTMVVYYLVSPVNAYDINEKVECKISYQKSYAKKISHWLITQIKKLLIY